jgi:transketolase
MKITFIPHSEFERILNADMEKFERLQIIGDMCRLNIISAIKKAGSGHIGSSLSSMDIFVFLYFYEMNTLKMGFDNPDRDIFFSSKGHDAPGQYSALMAAGIITFDKLIQLRRLNGLEGHPEITTMGIEANTGSLGMGISKARGMAFAKMLDNNGGRILVLTGDGELQEGQVWESFQNTAHQQINNIIVIVDANKIQTDKPVKEIIELKNLEDKLAVFGWHVERCDGHNFHELNKVFTKFRAITDKPKILIADTIKGKGVSFMERLDNGIYKWHSGAPDNGSYQDAIDELIAKINKQLESAGMETVKLEIIGHETTLSYKVSDERIVNAYGDALVDIGGKRKDIVVLDADLSADCGLRRFEKTFPERFIENGISEQDMVSMAGGLALHGYLPIVHSFSVFLSSRANEQIFNNATENTKIIYVCNYAGLLPAGPGVSHQGVRDISLFGALPNCIVVEPCNSLEAKLLLNWCVNDAKESCMLRLSIFPSPGPIVLPDGYKLILGKGTVLKEGKDAILFTYGPVMLHEAVKASEILEKEGVSLKVVNMPWLNRVDKGWFEEIAEGCSSIFVMDNHSAVGGLGDCLLNTLISSRILKNKEFYKVAIEGYPECGQPAEVLRFHGMDAEGIVKRVKAVMER